MATETKTKTEAVASAKVAEAIRALADAKIVAEGKVLTTVRTTQSEAKRLGYDKDTARQMVVLSWRRALNLSDKADEETIAAFDKTNRPDVSKIMLLAFPDDSVRGEIEKVLAHNEKHPAKNQRVGVNRLYEVARGNQKAAEAIAHKPLTRVVKDPVVSKLPVSKQFGNAIAALRKQFCNGEKGSLALSEARKIAAAGLADSVE
jgi:hypothetical protein